MFKNFILLYMNNIQILARIKPNLNNHSDNCISIEKNNVIVKKIKKNYINDYFVNYKYKFDNIYDEYKSNLDIYNNISIEILNSLIKKNKNVTFYVYGQTGSGKTHTILGNINEKGLLEFILNDLIELDYKLKISIVEIYNNKCLDLLNNSNIIYQREDYTNNFIVNDMKKFNLLNLNDIKNLINMIFKKRKTGESSENNTSSRSHLQITIEFDNKFFRILDLAGCEKAKKSICSTKDEYRENGEINQSLFALKECIRSLIEKKKHIPFRRCELTKMLKHSFDQNSKTYILSTLSQELYNSNTTIDVLNYISEMKNIKKIITNKNIYKKKILNTQNHLDSPNYKKFRLNNLYLKELINDENKIINDVINKKTSKNLLEKYRKILERKIIFFNELR